MKKKLIFIFPNEFTKKEYEKNSIQYFLKKNIEIEIWIVGKVVDSSFKLNKKIFFCNKDIKLLIVKSFKDLRHLLNNIKKLNYNYLIDLRIKLSLKSFRFFKIFFTHKLNYIIFPSLELTKISKHFFWYLKFVNLIIKLKFLLNNIQIFPAKYVYIISQKSDIKNNLLISKNSKLIYGHHPDFDRYLEFKNKKNKKYKFKYFVFLDQNVPHHSDLKRFSIADVDEKKYYESLLFFFKKLEKKFKYKFIISAHPRCDIKILKKYFNSRVSNQSSIELIKNCEFVICHDSTATNFAFLFNKSIVPVINNQLINSDHPHKKEIISFCKRANLKLFNISKDNIDKIDLTINDKKYKDYIFKYIGIKQSFCNRVEKILNNIEFIK